MRLNMSGYKTYQDYLGNIVVKDKHGWNHIKLVMDDPIYQTWYVHYREDLYVRTVNNTCWNGCIFDRSNCVGIVEYTKIPIEFIEPILLNKNIEPVCTITSDLGWHKSRLDRIAKQLGAATLQWVGNDKVERFVRNG